MVRVEIQPEAEVQLKNLDTWWRKNRPTAATQIVHEYARLVDLIRTQPEVGLPYARRGLKNIRCVRMRRTPYKLYYHYEPGGEVATIVSAWSAMRKAGPRIILP